MYKTKKVAWHKHLTKAKKQRDKAHAARTAATPQRQTTPRR